MKKYLVLLLAISMLLSACSISKELQKPIEEGDGSIDESFDFGDPAESVDDGFTVDDTSTSDEVSMESEEEPRYTISDYAEDMANLDNLPAAASEPLHPDYLEFASGSKSFQVGTTVDVDAFLDAFLTGMDEIEHVDSSDGIGGKYSDGIAYAKVERYNTGRTKFNYYPLEEDNWAMDLTFTIDNGKVHEAWLTALGYLGHEFAGDVTVDGINLNNSLEDVLAIYGKPTKALASKHYKGWDYDVDYYWEGYMGGTLRITFEVIEVDDPECKWGLAMTGYHYDN